MRYEIVFAPEADEDLLALRAYERSEVVNGIETHLEMTGRVWEKDRMIQVPLNKVKDDLSRYLRLAETEDVIITRHGVPAGILIGFEDPEAWWEELLVRDPRFRERVSQARSSLREGRGITIEQLREKYDIEPPAA